MLCVRVSAASHGDDGVADHGRELGRLDRWLLPTHLKRISFLHRQCAERWETCLTRSEGCVLKLFFVTSKHMGWKLIWQSNLTRRDSSWRCVFLSSRGRKSAAVHPQVRTAFQFSVSFFPQWRRSNRHITNGGKQVNSIYFKSLSHLIFHFPWKHNICCFRQFSSRLPSAVMQI